ncbi:hypothetical protein LTR85_007428 [Meristemomyces frigidus]|nr:hypothetical protein LTR85_007428 [Meristemomyces frigidus]
MARRFLRDKSPAQCLLTTLPSELLHCVFESLDVHDVVAARATCSVLAAIGIEYMLEEVPLVYKRDRFERLLDIAKHPYLSGKVRSLFFQCDRFTTGESFEEWQRHIRDPNCPTEYSVVSEYTDEIYEGRRTPRGKRAYAKAHKRYQHGRGVFTQRQLDTAYQCYLAAAEDQQSVAREGLDVTCLKALFDGCQQLDRVTFALGSGPMRRSDALQRAFANTLRSPWGDATKGDEGLTQLSSLAMALCASQHTLRDLTLTEISARAFYPNVLGWEPMAYMTKDLHRLRLELQTCMSEDEELGAEAILAEMMECIEDGYLHRMLRSATGLRDLKLHFPAAERLGNVAWLGEIFQYTTWNKLRKLQLCHVLTVDIDLVALLLRHKKTLQEVDLFYIDLWDGSWEDLFTQIAGQLPRLRRIRLRGVFVNEDNVIEFNFHPAMVTPQRDAIEQFILKGGAWPDLEAISAYEQYPWDVPDYVEPTASHDEDGYSSDGSAEWYESDEFERI